MSFGKFISPRLFFYRDTKNRIGGKFALIWKHHFIKANFCYALTALFFRRRRKTNAATEKRFSQFSFLTIFTTPFLQAASKDKRGNRKTFLSIFLFDHLHRPIFTGGIERQTRQEKNVSFNFPFCSSSPPRFYRRYRKTNAATEKCFFQFSFWFIFTALFLQVVS